jgi:hypothetical protein
MFNISCLNLLLFYYHNHYYCTYVNKSNVCFHFMIIIIAIIAHLLTN